MVRTKWWARWSRILFMHFLKWSSKVLWCSQSLLTSIMTFYPHQTIYLRKDERKPEIRIPLNAEVMSNIIGISVKVSKWEKVFCFFFLLVVSAGAGAGSNLFLNPINEFSSNFSQQKAFSTMCFIYFRNFHADYNPHTDTDANTHRHVRANPKHIH